MKTTQRGFTLIELIVVIALIAIMMGLAAPSFVRFQRSSELTSATNSLVGSMAAARAEAMKRNRNAFVLPLVADDWRGGWTVFVDMNANNAFDNGVDVLVMTEAALPGSISVPAPTAGLNAFKYSTTTYIMFNGSGFPRQQAGGAFIVASGVEFMHDVKLRRRVVMTPAGRIRACNPVAEPGTCVP